MKVEAGSPERALGEAKCKAIDFEWENLCVRSTTFQKVIENGKKVTKRTDKMILNNINGSVKHNRFTAIMGPSGSFFFFVFLNLKGVEKQLY